MRAFSYGTPAKTAGFRLFALGCCVGAQVGHFGARNARVTGRSACVRTRTSGDRHRGGAVPLDGLLQAVFEADDRLVAEQLLRLGDARLRVTDVAGARLSVDRLDLRALMNSEITPEYGDDGSWRGPNTLK
jgi:hypothetical protein